MKLELLRDYKEYGAPTRLRPLHNIPSQYTYRRTPTTFDSDYFTRPHTERLPNSILTTLSLDLFSSAKPHFYHPATQQLLAPSLLPFRLMQALFDRERELAFDNPAYSEPFIKRRSRLLQSQIEQSQTVSTFILTQYDPLTCHDFAQRTPYIPHTTAKSPSLHPCTIAVSHFVSVSVHETLYKAKQYKSTPQPRFTIRILSGPLSIASTPHAACLPPQRISYAAAVKKQKPSPPPVLELPRISLVRRCPFTSRVLPLTSCVRVRYSICYLTAIVPLTLFSTLTSASVVHNTAAAA